MAEEIQVPMEEVSGDIEELLRSQYVFDSHVSRLVIRRKSYTELDWKGCLKTLLDYCFRYYGNVMLKADFDEF